MDASGLMIERFRLSNEFVTAILTGQSCFKILGSPNCKRGATPKQCARSKRLLHTASSETYLWLAEAWDGAGDPQKAYDAYAKAIEKDPKSEHAYAALSNFAVAHHNTSFALGVLGQGLQKRPRLCAIAAPTGCDSVAR